MALMHFGADAQVAVEEVLRVATEITSGYIGNLIRILHRRSSVERFCQGPQE
jgi:hypothetical protein